MNTFTLGLIVIVYLLSLAYLGFLGYKKTTSASDYLVGGRQMNPVVMALSYGATFISASAIVGFGGVAAAFLPAYFCALYWKGATRQGVMASLWVGTLGSLFALVFLHQKESSALGVCRALFGRNVLIETYPFPVVDPILFALPLSVAAILPVSLMTARGRR